MRLYIIPAWYPKNEQDLDGVFFREQAHALAARGHDVTVLHILPVSVTRLFRQPVHVRREWQDGSVRTIFHQVIVPIPGKMGTVQDSYISSLFYRIIADEIHRDQQAGRGRPDILHAHVSHTCGYYCLEAAKRLRIPLAVTEHYSGLLLGCVTPREYQRVHDTIEGADAFIFVGSNFQKTLCEKLDIRKKTYVIPNMVDTSLFPALQPKREENERPFAFLTACSLKKNKSVDLVIRAFHAAFEKNEHVSLRIAGDGEAMASLRALTAELEEDSRISFYGRYSREECSAIFCDADAFVLTSQVETFGIVYVEAMMAGLPCIGTRGQGAEDIITAENGLLVDYGDVEQLARAMKTLRDSKEAYSAVSIRNQCVRRFAPDMVCEAIEDVYRTIQQKT